MQRLFRLLMLLIFVLSGTSGLSAQDKLKFSIAEFYQNPHDFSPIDKQYERVDGNGDRYAIIKVTSNNPNDKLSEYNFNFGNLKHIIDDSHLSDTGELWIYVQRNAKIVSISRDGYAPINKYDLRTTIEKGKAYVMSLTSEAIKVYMQMVQFDVTPANSKASVIVKSYKEDSQEDMLGTIDATGRIAKSLEYGSYTYKVLAENYYMAEGRFTLNNKNETKIEQVELKPNFSDMTFSVDADADIYINGIKKGTRQWSGILKSGNYLIECRQANHKPSSQNVQVIENDNRTIKLKAPEPILGTVAITSNPLGANIMIDGKQYGQTPKNIDVVIGKHTVTISKEGYQAVAKSFEVSENKAINVDVTLSRKTTVSISSKPSNSKLYIDGVFKGNTPYKYEGDIGQHRVKLLSQGYKPFDEKVHFGSKEELVFSLQKQLVKRTDFYIDAGIGLGSLTNASAAIGTHLANFNMEFYYCYGLKKTPEINWYSVSDGDIDYSFSNVYYSPFIMGGKIGYGFIAGTRFKLTPQIGYRYTKYSAETEWSIHDVGRPLCSAATIGLRTYFAISSHFGISITPEYAISLSESTPLEMISELSPETKNMGKGFNAKFALVLTF